MFHKHRVDLPYLSYFPYTTCYQKVRRLMRLNEYLESLAYKFCREYNAANVSLHVEIQAKYVDN